MPYLIYPCGCRFEILNSSYMEDVYVEDYSNHNIPIKYDIYHLPDCKETWNTFAKGNTKGVFQLEKGLGKSWSKKMKPEKLGDLSALVALLRPSCLNAMSGDPPKSLSQHFVDRKNGNEPTVYEIEALRPLLQDTYGIVTYQEQIILVAKELAGFTEGEADTLRRGFSKKKADIISELIGKFIDGCKKVGKVTEEEAKVIAGWISESCRYSFNKCLSPSTIVEDKNGKFKTLNEVTIGDFINTPEGFCEVLDVIDSGTKEVYRVTLECGNEIECTLDHKFLCEDGKIRELKEILIEDYVIVCEDGV